MNAIVVYESHWGNTEAVARAVAEGIGGDARALTTDEAVSMILLTLFFSPVLLLGYAIDVTLIWLALASAWSPAT